MCCILPPRAGILASVYVVMFIMLMTSLNILNLYIASFNLVCNGIFIDLVVFTISSKLRVKLLPSK